MTILILILLPCLFVIGTWCGALIQMMETKDHYPKLLKDGMYSRALLGGHALLFGPEGQIVEAHWYSATRSAKEFGGRTIDYISGWIDHDGEAVDFKPVGLLPIPRPAQ